MNVEVKDITSKGVHFIAASGETMILEPDTIIPALPLNPDPVLFESLNKLKEVYPVRESLEPGLISDAVGGSADIGYKL